MQRQLAEEIRRASKLIGVHRQLLDRRAVGAGVLLVSEDLEELLALCDRLVVLFEGRIAGELAAVDATPERLGLLMTGAAA